MGKYTWLWWALFVGILVLGMLRILKRKPPSKKLPEAEKPPVRPE